MVAPLSQFADIGSAGTTRVDNFVSDIADGTFTRGDVQEVINILASFSDTENAYYEQLIKDDFRHGGALFGIISPTVEAVNDPIGDIEDTFQDLEDFGQAQIDLIRDADTNISDLLDGVPIRDIIPDLPSILDPLNLEPTIEDTLENAGIVSLEDALDPETAHGIPLDLIDATRDNNQEPEDLFNALEELDLIPSDVGDVLLPGHGEDTGNDLLSVFDEALDEVPSVFDGLEDFISDDIIPGVTGETAADAALAGSQSQIDFARDAMATLRGDLEPFRNLLSDNQLQDLSHLATDPFAQQEFLTTNPLLEQLRGDVKGASFRTGEGGFSTDQALDKVISQNSNDLINQQINRQLPLLAAAQSSAAQQGLGSSNLLTQAGNSAAAGAIGAANAEAQGSANLLGLISTLIGAA